MKQIETTALDRTRSATIRDVAAASGVSVGTVSRSLNAPGTVRPATLERVRAAIEGLGFRPDARAQNMRRRNTLTIGFIVNDILNPIHAMIFKSAEAELREHGYWLHLVNTGGKARQEAEAIDQLQHGRVDGMLMTINSEQDPHCLERLRRLRVPSVLLDRDIALACDVVRTDHASGMEQAVGYLLDLGHRRIALITAGTEILPGRERIRGFIEALRNRGVPVPPDFVRAQSLSAEFAHREALDLLRRPDRPTALIAGGNQLLVGVVRAVQQLGLAIPARPVADHLRPYRSRQRLCRLHHHGRSRRGRDRPHRCATAPRAADGKRRAQRATGGAADPSGARPLLHVAARPINRTKVPCIPVPSSTPTRICGTSR